MVVSEDRAIIECWFQDIFTRGKLSVLDDIIAADFIAHAQGGDATTSATCGREAFKAWLCWYRATFTDANWTIHDVIAATDKVVVRYSGWITYRGGLLNIPSTNQRVLETGITIFRIQDGKIQEMWCEMSDLYVMQQLGAFPTVRENG